MQYNWNIERAETSIIKSCDEVQEITITKYTKEKSLSNIKVNEAYEMDAVHLYVDILNLPDMLATDNGIETERSHLRALRFFDSHFQAIKHIISETESIFVDFHNQRLHAVIPKPYDDEKKRLNRAVTIAQIIIKVVEQQRELGVDEIIEAAELRIGIDSGISLAVNNGRKANKEPLFLGNPANYAAKYASGKEQGIYLTDKVRKTLNLNIIPDSQNTRLTLTEIQLCLESSKIDYQDLIDQTMDEIKNQTKKLSDFTFSRITPPLKQIQFQNFTNKNSKRQELASIYADIDGFTAYVSQNMQTSNGQKNIVRCLHVLRSELDACLNQDFNGRRVRFIGDCIHGILCEGNNKTTNLQSTAQAAVEACAGIRSSFVLAQEILNEKFNISCDLGLAIGIDLGENILSRVGKISDNTRLSLGLSTIGAEHEQKRCNGNQTSISKLAHSYLDTYYQSLFNSTYITKELTFDKIEKVHQNKVENDAQSNLYTTNDSTRSSLKAYVKNYRY